MARGRFRFLVPWCCGKFGKGQRPAVKTQLAKWGNSLAVRIPKAVAEAAKLRPGDQLDVSLEDRHSENSQEKR